MTEVRQHERRTPSGEKTRVRRHARKTPWSHAQADELTVAVGAFGFSLVMLIIWSLTAVMSVTAAILSTLSAVCLSALGFKMNRARKSDHHKKRKTPQRVPVKVRAKRKVRKARKWLHPGRELRLRTVAAVKRRMLGLEKRLAGKSDPRRAK